MFKLCQCLLAPFHDQSQKGLATHADMDTHAHLLSGLCTCLPPALPRGLRMCTHSPPDPSAVSVGAAALPDGCLHQ